MRIQETEYDGVTLVRLEGDLDSASAPAVVERMQTLTDTSSPRAVLDFGGVPFMSSAGVRMLLLAFRSARGNGGDIRLAAVAPAVAAVLEQTGLLSLIRVHSDARDALKDLGVTETAQEAATAPPAPSTGPSIDRRSAAASSLLPDGDAATPALEQHMSAVVTRGSTGASLDFRRAPLHASRAIREHVREAALGLGAQPDALDGVLLAVDEAITNIVLHGYRGRAEGKIEVSVERDGSDLVIGLYDDAPPFDPATVEPPDLTLPLEERPIGGMGIHLMRQNLDGITHRAAEGGGNELFLIKRNALGGGEG